MRRGDDLVTDESFSNVSPQFSAAVRLQPDKMVYVVGPRGFKAGGFNPASPAGSEAYGEEHAWNVEGGVKTMWAGGRVMANARVFRIDWDDLQLNLPDPSVPAQFYIANVGGATSTGVEVELNARVRPGVDVFGGVGYTRARVQGGQRLERRATSPATRCRTRPTTRPRSARRSRIRCGPDVTVYGRAEVAFYGAFQYDDLNTGAAGRLLAGQLPRRRARPVSVRRSLDPQRLRHAATCRWRSRTVQLAPSGFIGESGAGRARSASSAGVAF